MKKTLKWFLKLAAAGIVAFVLLNGAGRFYYYVPWNNASPNGATDFVFPGNFSGFNGLEGFAAMEIDENGYNNPYVPEEIDILCMGSSHTVGYCSAPGTAWPAVLARELGDQNTYNIGMFSHHLINCLDNLGAALEAYRPKSYVIIEFPNYLPDEAELEAFCDGRLPQINQVTGTAMRRIKSFPYLQLAGHQIKNILRTTEAVESAPEEAFDAASYEAALDRALARVQAMLEAQGCKGIFVCHKPLGLDETGAPVVRTVTNIDYLRRSCEKHGILLVEMSEIFAADYLENHRRHYGFSNTAPGQGHLNEAGQQVIGQLLAELINGQ